MDNFNMYKNNMSKLLGILTVMTLIIKKTSN